MFPMLTKVTKVNYTNIKIVYTNNNYYIMASKYIFLKCDMVQIYIIIYYTF